MSNNREEDDGNLSDEEIRAILDDYGLTSDEITHVMKGLKSRGFEDVDAAAREFIDNKSNEAEKQRKDTENKFMEMERQRQKNEEYRQRYRENIRQKVEADRKEVQKKRDALYKKISEGKTSANQLVLPKYFQAKIVLDSDEILIVDLDENETVNDVFSAVESHTGKSVCALRPFGHRDEISKSDKPVSQVFSGRLLMLSADMNFSSH
ncbi:hypothetical protein ENBRE01_0926 [Enteropsectra breve]|nr:hypothetical protein ENBRE01_0926 [Enteropsectra breve]